MPLPSSVIIRRMWSPSCSAESTTASARLAGGLALLGRLDAVVDGVAHQVDQRVGQGFDQVLVEVGFLAHQLEVDLFLQVARQVADQAREAAEDLLDRLHARLHDGGLQVGGDHVEVGHGLGHGLVAAVQAEAHQAVTHQHQLADHVHDLVQARGVHAHRGLGFAGGRRGLVGRRRCSAAAGGSRLGRLGGLRSRRLRGGSRLGGRCGSGLGRCRGFGGATSAASATNLPLPCNWSSSASNSSSVMLSPAPGAAACGAGAAAAGAAASVAANLPCRATGRAALRTRRH